MWCALFDSEEVIHVDDSVDPVRDLETIQHELCAKDMEYLKRAVEQEKMDVKKNPTMKLSGSSSPRWTRLRRCSPTISRSARASGAPPRWR